MMDRRGVGGRRSDPVTTAGGRKLCLLKHIALRQLLRHHRTVLLQLPFFAAVAVRIVWYGIIRLSEG